MCPCFPARAEYAHLMEEKEDDTPVIQPKPVDNGPVISPNPKPYKPNIEPDTTRLNPIDFIIKLLIKLLTYVVRNIASRGGSVRK